NCICGRCAKGYAELRPRHCSRNSADGSLLSVCRFGVVSQGCELCIRNGQDTPTLGGVTATWCTWNGASAAKLMIRTCGTALIGICAMPPPGLTCRGRPDRLFAGRLHVCGVVLLVTAHSAIFQFWRT